MTNWTKFRRSGVALLLVGGLLATTACDRDELLKVEDPELVTPESVQGENGAVLFWAGALGEFASAYSSGGGGIALYAGMFSDEFILSGTFPTRNEVDRREIDMRNGTMLGLYRQIHRARVATENAVPVLEEFLAGDSRISEMNSLAGYSYLFFGENYCSGVPFSQTLASGELVFGEQSTLAETWTTALQRFDAAAASTAGDADMQYLAAVGRARTLLNQGDFAAAGAAVANVPADWVYTINHQGGGAFSLRNAIYEMNYSQRRWSLSDAEGGNGVPFRTATDSRVPWVDSGLNGFDEETPLFHQQVFTSWDDNVPLASGIEAQLIIAEAQLNAGDAAGWLDTHNALRTAAGLAAAADPGSQDERLRLHFEERARWLFGTAHRLGDLRRMIRQYGFTEDQVFPTGEFFKGGIYGDDVTFPIPFDETYNPNYDACIDRNA